MQCSDNSTTAVILGRFKKKARKGGGVGKEERILQEVVAVVKDCKDEQIRALLVSLLLF